MQRKKGTKQGEKAEENKKTELKWRDRKRENMEIKMEKWRERERKEEKGKMEEGLKWRQREKRERGEVEGKMLRKGDTGRDNKRKGEIRLIRRDSERKGDIRCIQKKGDIGRERGKENEKEKRELEERNQKKCEKGNWE